MTLPSFESATSNAQDFTLHTSVDSDAGQVDEDQDPGLADSVEVGPADRP